MMSWYIALINSKEKIKEVTQLDESQLVETNLCERLENHFEEVLLEDDQKTIIAEDFEIHYFVTQKMTSCKILSVYGAQGMIELIALAKKEAWQIYDARLHDMIDLENPERSGYKLSEVS